ncbi:1-acyl-sn-glycerol-3-phosphate acyltransferase [Streptomyces sp. GbtcB6]|uniref:lysophospholipid acyltransferase family protein n=1 Tax=Streptomyces sp. GbtcB6 TaxID=2824751 RepID=UPI0020C6D4DD|nr:lysophospholipid acyltransferase family protein [Streptomyces sp. GbtcB6]
MIFKATVLSALRIWFRPKVDGIRNLPPGPAIIAGNHLSFSDTFFLAAVLPRRVTFMVKSSLFTGPGVKGWLISRFFRSLGQLPVDRDGGSAGDTALQTGVQVLRRGGLLGVFPEGTRSPDGRLYRGRTGIARIVLATGCPVVPVALIGTDRIQPPGATVPKRAPLVIRIGEPLDFPAGEGAESDRAALRAITDDIMRGVQRLSGQEYADEYSPGPGLR